VLWRANGASGHATTSASFSKNLGFCADLDALFVQGEYNCCTTVPCSFPSIRLVSESHSDNLTFD
jgi:hypothetical protein